MPDTNTSGPDNPIVDRISSVLREFGIINPDDKELSPVDRSIAVVEDPSRAVEFIDALFPNSIPLDATFFDEIRELRRWVGVGEKADLAIGKLWLRVLAKLARAEKKSLLKTFSNQDGHDLFENLGCLHVVAVTPDVDAEFWADCFEIIAQKIERDLAQGSFWRAVDSYCAAHIDGALDTASELSKRPTPVRLRVSSFIVGILRGISMDEGQQKAFARTESYFRDHQDDAHRSCFHWSWATTAAEHGLTLEQVDFLILRAEKRFGDDHNSILGAVCSMLRSSKLADDVFSRAFNWAAGQVSSDLSRDAKYQVANGISVLQRIRKDRGQEVLDCSSWIIAMQPVSHEDGGTWGRIQDYLVELLSSDRRLFGDTFVRLARRNAVELLRVMRQPRSFDWLLGEMSKADMASEVGQLMLDLDGPTRKVGLFLFDELEIERIPDSAFSQSGDLGVRLLFYELQRTHHGADAVARVFVSLIPKVTSMENGFYADFRDELSLQARNFSGGCRKELARLGGDFPLVKDVLDKLAKHFTELDRVHESGIGAIRVLGAERAGLLHKRRMSRQVSESANEHSVLLSLFKKVRLLYGSASSAYVGGKMLESTPLSQISTEFEIPFVDFCDPEGMAIRRFQASAAIEALSK